MQTSEQELMKWKKSRKARRKFARKLSAFAQMCDVDTVIVDDVPKPRVVCYIIFRQRPSYQISYEESLLIQGINAPVFLVVANPSFSVFETDFSLPQFDIYSIDDITDSSYELTTKLRNASWSNIKTWIEQVKIDTRSQYEYQERSA